MILIYKILVYILFFFSLPFLPFVYAASSKRRATLLPRLGWQPKPPSRQPGEKRLWVHALSLGEVKSSLPFVTSFKKKYPDWKIIFTASTKTGFETAQQHFFKDEHLLHHLMYFPFDIGFSIHKTLHAIDPDAVVLVETDLWPGFLYEMESRSLPVVLINARVSKRTLAGYTWYKRLFFPFYKQLSHVMAQTKRDAQRFAQLGLPDSKLTVTGNIKFDQQVRVPDKTFFNDIRTRAGFKETSQILLAGSTHEGEESVLLNVYSSLKLKTADLRMIIAPRDPKRSSALAEMFLSHHVQAGLLSELPKPDIKEPVVFVDSIGLLADLYALCDVAFVGGSLVRCGGHNPLEPAAFSKPVLFGPDMSDFDLISQLLTEQGGAVTVSSQTDLETVLTRLFQNSGRINDMGEACGRVFARHSGAVGKTIMAMEQLHIV